MTNDNSYIDSLVPEPDQINENSHWQAFYDGKVRALLEFEMQLSKWWSEAMEEANADVSTVTNDSGALQVLKNAQVKILEQLRNHVAEQINLNTDKLLSNERGNVDGGEEYAKEKLNVTS